MTHLVLYFAAGAALGTAYFMILLRTVVLHTADVAVIRVIPLYVARLAAAVVGFWLIALQGGQPLLAALLGFLVARVIVQRWSGSA